MILLTPLFLALAVGVLLLCVALAAVLGAVCGPCAAAVNIFSNDCSGLWFIIMLISLPIIIVVCSIGAAVKIFYEGTLIFLNVLESYISTIPLLLCPPEPVELDFPFDEII